MESLILGNWQEWNEKDGNKNGIFTNDYNDITNPKHVNESSFLNFARDNKKLTTLNLTINLKDMK